MASNRFTILILSAWCAAVSPCQTNDSDGVYFRQKIGFSLLYDDVRKCPCLVWWCIRPQDLTGISRLPGSFFSDDYTLPSPRAKSKWFTHSGYQRGHLCPAADRKRNAQFMKATFIMSNVAPMTPFLNTRPWKYSEDYTRRHCVRCGRTQVVAGCLWSAPVNYSSKVNLISVPDTLFRCMLCPNDSSHNVFWLFPQSATLEDEKRYRVSKHRFLSSMKYYFHKYITTF